MSHAQTAPVARLPYGAQITVVNRWMNAIRVPTLVHAYVSGWFEPTAFPYKRRGVALDDADSGIEYLETEGTRWIRGWCELDGAEAKALLVAHGLVHT